MEPFIVHACSLSTCLHVCCGYCGWSTCRHVCVCAVASTALQDRTRMCQGEPRFPVLYTRTRRQRGSRFYSCKTLRLQQENVSTIPKSRVSWTIVTVTTFTNSWQGISVLSGYKNVYTGTGGERRKEEFVVSKTVRYGTVRVELDQVNNARGIPPKTVQLERSPNTVSARAYDREDVSYPPSRDP
jgi:hypothetical protein